LAVPPLRGRSRRVRSSKHCRISASHRGSAER
jgi:hypothetical protein